MFLFYTPWKHEKTFSFLVFSEGVKWEHWPQMGWTDLYPLKTPENYIMGFKMGTLDRNGLSSVSGFSKIKHYKFEIQWTKRVLPESAPSLVLTANLPILMRGQWAEKMEDIFQRVKRLEGIEKLGELFDMANWRYKSDHGQKFVAFWESQKIAVFRKI